MRRRISVLKFIFFIAMAVFAAWLISQYSHAEISTGDMADLAVSPMMIFTDQKIESGLPSLAAIYMLIGSILGILWSRSRRLKIVGTLSLGVMINDLIVWIQVGKLFDGEVFSGVTDLFAYKYTRVRMIEVICALICCMISIIFILTKFVRERATMSIIIAILSAVVLFAFEGQIIEMIKPDVMLLADARFSNTKT